MKVEVLQDTKDENAALKQRWTRYNVDRLLERDNLELRNEVKKNNDCIQVWNRNAKELRKDLASTENEVVSLSKKKRALDTKIEKLEKSVDCIKDGACEGRW